MRFSWKLGIAGLYVLLIVGVLLYSMIFALSQYFDSQTPPSIDGEVDVNPKITYGEVFRLVNRERNKAGIPTLKRNPLLDAAASKKAEDMFEKDYWSHTSPDGRGPWEYIEDVGYAYLTAGENLARGMDSSREVVDSWIESKSHRANLLYSGYKEVGYAIKRGSLTGENTYLVVQMFGTLDDRMIRHK